MPPPIPTIPSPRNDQITGTSADDIIDALAGNDVVRAGDGDDVVLGNLGNDKLFGEDGSDRLSGDQGNDDIDGGDGLDTAVYTGSRDDYQVTTDANGVTEVKDLRGQGSKTPDGIDHIVNTEFFEFADGTFQLENGVFVPADDTNGFIDSQVTLLETVGEFFGPVTVGSEIEINHPGAFTFDISDDEIIFNYYRNSGVIDFPNSYVFEFSDEGAPDISGIASLETNMAGLEFSDITFDKNIVAVNLTGTTLLSDSYFKINVDFV